jgi:uncharacterized protein (DUF1330 family)
MQRIMLSVALLGVGAVIGGAVGSLQAQSQGQLNLQNKVFVITEQKITDQNKYNTEFSPKAQKTIIDHQGQFVVRTNKITGLLQGTEPAPTRIVITAFPNMDQVQRWQNSAEYKELAPIRGQSMQLIRQYAVHTCAPTSSTQVGTAQQMEECPN